MVARLTLDQLIKVRILVSQLQPYAPVGAALCRPHFCFPSVRIALELCQRGSNEILARPDTVGATLRLPNVKPNGCPYMIPISRK